jgi:peptide/nickel transport system permease protein
MLRDELIDAEAEEFVQSARAKGLSRGKAVLKHALPSVLVPVATLLGMQASFLLSGAIIVENVFSLPGLGRLLLQAVTQRDLLVVQGGVLLLVAAVVGCAMAADMACAALDPRWRRRL